MNLRWKWVAGLVSLALSAGLAASPACGQFARSPELNMQYHRAETALRSGGSVLEAKARVDRVLRELPEDIDARKLRAQVLLAMNRPAEALVDARRAAELSPADGEAQLLLCEAARRVGNRPLAEHALDRASELVLDNASFHLRLSWNAELLEDLDKAESFARIALALDSTDAAAYYQLARVFSLKAQPDDAAAVLARGLRTSLLDPAVIEADSVLVRITYHPSVQALLRR